MFKKLVGLEEKKIKPTILVGNTKMSMLHCLGTSNLPHFTLAVEIRLMSLCPSQHPRDWLATMVGEWFREISGSCNWLQRGILH